MIKNILYFLGSILIFFTGTIVYGIVLNSTEQQIDKIITQKGIHDFSRIRIVVYQQKYRLDIYSDTVFIKSYRAVFGRNSTIPKILKSKKTLPVGNYKICEIDLYSRYRKFFKLNFPRIYELEDAVKGGYITRDQYFDIFDKLKQDDCYSDKKLNSIRLGIHGIGELDFIFKNLPFVYNWTNGSIAVSNDAIDEIYSVIKVGTEVDIKN